jgi:kinesin family protein 15
MSIRKKQLELESELQSLQKANLNLENLLEATKVCKRQEVSQLNKLHAETLKVGIWNVYLNWNSLFY